MQLNTTIRRISLAYIDFDSTWKSIKDNGVSCEVSQLTSMEELHFLILDMCDVIVLDGFSSWPKELRWLRWRQYCFAKLPSHLNLPLLVVLDLSFSTKLT